jgi:WD repeat-containing protein 35
LHVLAALEIERHRKKTLDQAASNATKAGGTLDGATNTQNIAMATAATLESLMMTSLDTQDGVTQATLTTTQGARKASRAFGNAWRGAAAYHYYMLAQRLFYSGNYDNAMKCSIKLCEYDDVLNPRDIYSLLALTAYFNKFYGICSQAFVKVPSLSPSLSLPSPLSFASPLLCAQLETIPSIPEVERDKIETLAVKIFVKHSPVDPSILPEPYLKCLSMGKPYKACIITGRYGHPLLLPLLPADSTQQSDLGVAFLCLQDMSPPHVRTRPRLATPLCSLPLSHPLWLLLFWTRNIQLRPLICFLLSLPPPSIIPS